MWPCSPLVDAVVVSAASPGGHLVTTAQFNKPPSPGLYSFVYALWGATYAFAMGASWPGSSNSSNVGWGQWSWIDGTNASNLNCYTPGCSLWRRLDADHNALLACDSHTAG